MQLVNLNLDKSNINNYLSNTLLKSIEENINNNKKIILYLNKRWEYSSLICSKCSHLHKCPNCDVSMSVHSSNMVCHICNYSENIISKCKNCWSSEIKKVWVWTQQIENTLRNIFKNINIFRLDTDIVKNKSSKEFALENIKNAQIIIWTKMITTWFNIENLWLISVILIEQELQIAKYNTLEKVYSNITQLIWRWWRLWEKTEFIIQTYIPENEIIKTIVNDNYKDFFIKTLKERKDFKYPPYCELVTLEYKNKDNEKAKIFSEKLFNKIKKYDNENKYDIILAPNYFRKNNQYFYKIIIKWDDINNILNNIKSDIFKNADLAIIFE